MYQIKAHQVKVPKQKQLKSVLHLGVGVNGARWRAGKNYNAFKAFAFAGAFFV